MKSILGIKRVHFWTFENNGWVKITLAQDQNLSHSSSKQTDEGFSFEETTWTFDGDLLTREWRNGGSDCDGYIERTGIEECTYANVAAFSVFSPDANDYFNGNLIRHPDWHTSVPVSVYDRSAQAMGY